MVNDQVGSCDSCRRVTGSNTSSSGRMTFLSLVPTHLGELKFALGAALSAVASRQLVEYGAASSPLVLVRVFRFVVGVVVRFPVVVRYAAAPPSPGTC